MNTSYPFKLVNVFAESHFGGNPLAVFPDADGLDDEQMQLIARQFNLSETVFIQSSQNSKAIKALRIFTPDYELPFAGHPTLGSAFILQQALGLTEPYYLETQAGLVELQHQSNHVRLALKRNVQFEPISDINAYAAMLGILPQAIVEIAWVDTGSKQCLVKLTNRKALQQCRINAEAFLELLSVEGSIYLWYKENQQAQVRLFFSANGAICEDPGTGSAAVNLGGWHIVKSLTPIELHIQQGIEIQRPNYLHLQVDEEQTIYVGGKVILVGQGEFFVPQHGNS